jgi:hypothetical protein
LQSRPIFTISAYRYTNQLECFQGAGPARRALPRECCRLPPNQAGTYLNAVHVMQMALGVPCPILPTAGCSFTALRASEPSSAGNSSPR